MELFAYVKGAKNHKSSSWIASGYSIFFMITKLPMLMLVYIGDNSEDRTGDILCFNQMLFLLSQPGYKVMLHWF